MSAHNDTPVTAAIEQYEALASTRCRRLVTVLDAAPKPLPPAALAVAQAVADREEDPADVSKRTIHQYRVALEHSHLPQLAASGLVEYDGERVTVTDEAVAAVRTLADAVPDGSGGSALLDALKHERRRTVVSVLARTPQETLPLTSLAVAVTTATHERERTASDSQQLEQVRTSLHHVHLPKLAEVDILEYDPERRTVTDTGTETVDSAWVPDAVPVEPVSTDGGHPVPTSPASDVWTIDDPDSVGERTRALADHADEELAVLLTVEGRLTPRCLAHLRMATERGVDVTVGSPVESVQGRIRTAVPGATVWTPQFDWLDTVSSPGEQVSRLVVADRRAAMLATTDGECERALTGDGRDNGLVRAVRELLEPRLDTADSHDPDPQPPASP